MKVLILGPVVSKETSGGVAIFDEGLYNGFAENGDEVYLASSRNSINIKNILISKKEIKTSALLHSFNKIAKIIKTIQPDLVISSLQYSIGIKKYKKKWPYAKYIQILHGFPCPSNGKFKAFLINSAARYSKKHFDKMVTVSYLSYAINKKMINLECDSVIENGCNIPLPSYHGEKVYDFVYVGRLYRDKEVGMIAKSFELLKKANPNLHFAIAGYGELESLFNNDDFKDSGVEFLGKLDQSKVSNLLAKSKFFVSMNSLEPFGIVFCEALICGCNIVTQSSSGCASTLIKDNHFHIADCKNSIELSKRLIEISDEYVEIDEEEKREYSQRFSYKNCAKQYKDLIKND